MCNDLMKGLQGDMISLFKLADQLGNDNSHIRSMLATLVTGQTYCDHLPDYDENKPAGLNLLVREIFRIFETAAKTDLWHEESMTDAKADNFVMEVFQKNVPLYMTLLLTDDQNVLDALFNMSIKFNKSLIDEKDGKYMKMFLEFINPFVETESTKPIMSLLIDKQLKNQNDKQMDIPVFSEKEGAGGAPTKVDTLEFLNGVFDVATSEDPVDAVTVLFD